MKVDGYVDIVSLTIREVNSVIAHTRSILELHWAPSFTYPAVLTNLWATFELLRLVRSRTLVCLYS
jgi:hypothetical protein